MKSSTRILLYTNDLDFSQSLSLLFKEEFKITFTNDKNSLKDSLQFLKPNMLIIDSMINEKLIQLLEEIKSLYPNCKIILLTTLFSAKSDYIKKVQQMVDKLCQQPIDPDELTKTLYELSRLEVNYT